MPTLGFVPAVTQPSRTDIADEITRQVIDRGAGKSICPSEVARALASDWRAMMDDVRAVAADLAATGEIAVTQKGVPVDARTVKGPIRLRMSQESD